MTDSNFSAIEQVGIFCYGIYAWMAFIFAVFFAILATLIVPGTLRRRRAVAICGRLSLRLAGVRTFTRGLENLPNGDCVVVSNHASYIDGVFLQAFLPSRFSFVVKGEMERVPFVGFLLRRIGCRFVERFESSGSARDARRLLKAASAGESLAVFPEGTFVAQPGLGRFRPGAFVAAIRAGIPVVPAVISGSRQILPANTKLPRRGNLRLDVLDPIDISSPSRASSKEIAALARTQILTVLDEPDLFAAIENDDALPETHDH